MTVAATNAWETQAYSTHLLKPGVLKISVRESNKGDSVRRM
ncbi:MAG: hypothetical protein ACFCAD_23370 [Pleurocapsa sp.]